MVVDSSLCRSNEDINWAIRFVQFRFLRLGPFVKFRNTVFVSRPWWVSDDVMFVLLCANLSVHSALSFEGLHVCSLHFFNYVVTCF